MKQTVLLGVLLMFMVVVVGCATDGSGRIQPATATNTTASTAQTARDQETAGGTYLGIGGDVTYNIHPKPGVTIPSKVSDAIAKVIGQEDATLADKTTFIEALGKIYGFNCTITTSENSGNSGNVDLAGSTGKTGIPPVNEQEGGGAAGVEDGGSTGDGQ